MDMDREERAQKLRKFDDSALEWKLLDQKNDPTAVEKLPAVIIAGFELFDDGTEKIFDDLEKFLRVTYDPKKGSPSHYWNYAMRRRKYDNNKKDGQVLSLDDSAPNGENGVSLAEYLLGEAEKVNNPNPTLTEVEADSVLTDLVSIVLNLPYRLNGRANNEEKVLYYRLFFTDSFVDICHTYPIFSSFIKHESDAFEAMRVGFLDYFMEEVCRTIQQIRSCNVKLYGKMVEGCPMQDPGHPLPNNVYKTYLNGFEGFDIHSDGTISNQRTAYKEFLRENLFGSSKGEILT